MMNLSKERDREGLKEGAEWASEGGGRTLARKKQEGPPKDLGGPLTELGGPQKKLGGSQNELELGGPQRELRWGRGAVDKERKEGAAAQKRKRFSIISELCQAFFSFYINLYHLASYFLSCNQAPLCTRAMATCLCVSTTMLMMEQTFKWN